MSQAFHSIGIAAPFASFGEPAVFRASSQAEPRSITVVLDREPPAPMEIADAEAAPAQRIEVHVRNDSTHGIAATELDRGTGRIELAWRIGDTPTSRAIAKIVRQDRAVLVLEVR
jgi:hypothetical protein